MIQNFTPAARRTVLAFMAIGSIAIVSSEAGGANTINGYRRYNSACDHCHGPDGVGSTFAPSLVNRTFDIGTFRRVVLGGQASGDSVMKGFANDPNIAPYVDDIFAYLQARAAGALGRGRPAP